MDTRRPPNNTSKPFARKNNFQRDGERTFGETKYQSRDNRFQNRDGKFQPRNDRYQPRGRFAPKGKGFKPWEKDDRPRVVSEMQVTDGKHRGKYLTNTASPKITLTPRRIRETMFKIMFRRVRAGRFLDLCAGSGMVGIEAISRGALLGTFVERSAKMCSFIKKNLASCGIKDGHGEIVEMEAAPFLKKMSKRRRFWDVIYFDPPFGSNYEEAMKYLSRGAGIKLKGTLVIEHHAEMVFPENIGVMKRWRIIIQGDSAISFYERK